MTAPELAATLAHLAVLAFVVAGVLFLVQARRLGGRVFLLAILLAVAAVGVGAEWLPK